jgi:cyclopropane-fatty-acyl-phospholipid synthase
VARERAQAAEVSEVDYRKRSRRFDRVVSVGIIEHVGIGHSPKFGKASELLTEDG